MAHLIPFPAIGWHVTVVDCGTSVLAGILNGEVIGKQQGVESLLTLNIIVSNAILHRTVNAEKESREYAWSSQEKTAINIFSIPIHAWQTAGL